MSTTDALGIAGLRACPLFAQLKRKGQGISAPISGVSGAPAQSTTSSRNRRATSGKAT